MSDAKTRVGFIGLGLMGNAATARLVDCGYQVTGYDIDKSKIDAAVNHGVVPAASPAEVAAASDVVITCLVDTKAVEAVALGETGVVQVDGTGKVLVDISTTVMETTKTLAEKLRAANGMGWVDAPVSGGPPAARSGALAIMAGGSDADIATVTPVMSDLAAGFTHFGPVGAGQVAKMVNQILVLNNYCILSEALALAEAGGIDAAKIPEALAAGHAGSNMLKSMFPRMIERNYEPAGYSRQILKDLDMLHDLAKGLKSPTPMSSQTASLFRILISKGHSELDGTAILKLYDQKDSV